MALTMMYITNNPRVAKIAEENTVDRIWVDLEYMGKAERQKGINSVKSDHTLSDIDRIKKAITKSELLVRINPMYAETRNEIEQVINRGADIIMLPMYRSMDEVKYFVDMINGRAKTLLLLETKEAEDILECTIKQEGIDEIHIGLNDLHLCYGKKFMFELLTDETVEKNIEIFKKNPTIKYGFGGIARLEEGLLPAKYVIAEHYRLGSTMAILSRSFYDVWHENNYEEIEEIFTIGMSEIRKYEEQLSTETEEFFENNKFIVKNIVDSIVNTMR